MSAPEVSAVADDLASASWIFIADTAMSIAPNWNTYRAYRKPSVSTTLQVALALSMIAAGGVTETSLSTIGIIGSTSRQESDSQSRWVETG
jgi:hypothetical protein